MNEAAEPRWWRWSVLGLVLAGACLVARLGTNPGYYNADELGIWHGMTGQPWFAWRWFVPREVLFYRPLGFSAFRTQLGLADGEPQLVHCLSVLHHLINAGLLGLLFRRLGLPVVAALLTMTLPICLPGVAWAAAIYDRLSFSFLALAALALTVRGVGALAAVPAVALALLTKETAVAFALPAWLLWWRRAARRDHFALVAVMTITAMVVGFVVWRLLAGQQAPEYRMAIDAMVPTRLARYLAFPFAFGAEDPRTIWGMRWAGLFGAAAWLALGSSAPRLLVAGLLVWLAPVGMIALLPKTEGHYLYPAAPGLALVTAAAFRSRFRAALPVLGALAVVHGWQVGSFYLRMGEAMRSLVAAHAELVPTSEPVDLIVAPGIQIGAAECFVHHLEAVRHRTRLRIRPTPTTTVWLELRADGHCVVHSR